MKVYINIKEIIAFPKNKKARDLLTEASSRVTNKPFEEDHINVIDENEE